MRKYVLMLLLLPQLSFAWQFIDLWLRPDQQAAYALQAGKAPEAAQLFTDPAWRATANYRAGNYADAAEQFADLDSATGYYNQGNALAHQHNYQAAIDAYDQALKLQPDFPDATFNKELLEKLLQQKPQPQNQPQQNQQQGKSQQDERSQAQQPQQSEQNDQQQNESSKNDSQNNSEQQPGQEQNTPGQSEQSDDQTPNQNPEQAQGTANPGDQAQATQKQPITAQQKQNEQQIKKWLQQIPDNPGGLLEAKFWRDHQRQQQEDDS